MHRSVLKCNQGPVGLHGAAAATMTTTIWQCIAVGIHVLMCEMQGCAAYCWHARKLPMHVHAAKWKTVSDKANLQSAGDQWNIGMIGS